MEAQAVNGLQQADFIKLITTELQFQDPLNPVDSTEFISQLTQFAALDETRSINTLMDGVATSLRSVSASMASVNNLGMAGLIGKEVQVAGTFLSHLEGAPDTLNYHLDAKARSIGIQVINSAGDVVRTFLGPQEAGMNIAIWDGLDNNGNPLPSGNYIFSVEAKDAKDLPVAATEYTSGQVTEVSYDNGIPYLLVNGSKAPAATVTEVRSTAR